jgi:hypothetical protein
MRKESEKQGIARNLFYIFGAVEQIPHAQQQRTQHGKFTNSRWNGPRQKIRIEHHIL